VKQVKHDQAQKLREKLNQLRNTSEAKTIAVISGKGGVGKSNFALNFALSLAKNNKKVLLFDLDIGMGNIDILLGLTPERSIVDMFEEDIPIDDIIEQGPHSLSYIAAGSGLSDIFHFSEEKLDYFYQQLQNLVQSYDYILFDMGAGVTNDSLHFILAANECFVVTTPEPTALTDGYAMIKHITQKQFDLPLYLVVNKAFSQKAGEKTMKRMQDVVSQFLNKSIEPLGILPDDRVVTKAVTSQVPFLSYDEKAKISQALTHLTNQYLEQNIDIHKKVPFRFVSKLKQFMLER